MIYFVGLEVSGRLWRVWAVLVFSRLTKINEQGKRIKQIMEICHMEILQRLKPRTFHRLMFCVVDFRANPFHWPENYEVLTIHEDR